jgi:Lrp/AsnC family transcriptional regulator for asnA, asnC and gidA
LSKYDVLDKEIIFYLNQNARMPSARIARQLDVSERTVNHRIKRLVESGVIQPVAVVNPSSFGYTLAVDILCELEVGFQSQVIQAIYEIPQLCYMAVSTGDQDIILRAYFRDSGEMNDFITHQLHQIPGMRRTRTVLLPRILKDTHQWLPPDEVFSSEGGSEGEMTDRGR